MIIIPFKESWVSLKYPGIKRSFYEISNLGNVRIVGTNETVPPYASTNGHVYIGLIGYDDQRHMYYLGKVVYCSFNDDTIPLDITDDHTVISYSNGNKMDNRSENVDICHENEQWKDLGVLGYNPGLWKLSSDGRIYGVRYKKLLKQRICHTPYMTIGGLVVNGKHGLSRYTHRLVAEAFVDNPQPEQYTIVNHIDGDKLNNHYMNLEWTDLSGNAVHASYLELRKRVYGVDSRSAKLNESQVRTVCKSLLRTNGNIYETSRETDVNIYAVRAIRNYRSWRQISIEYFPKRHFIRKRPNLSEAEVRNICDELLNNDMDLNRTLKSLQGVIDVTRSQLVGIVSKYTYRSITDDYF